MNDCISKCDCTRELQNATEFRVVIDYIYEYRQSYLLLFTFNCMDGIVDFKV